MPSPDSSDKNIRHKGWVRISHWIITISFLLLAYTGIVILMCHPRLYWGNAGNDLTPALFELPISRNYQHGGWEKSVAFFNEAGSPVTASRTYDIFNKNGWGRSLHFLSAWFLVVTGVVYVVFGILTGHFRSRLGPTRHEFTLRVFLDEILAHLRMQLPSATNSTQYNLLQKWSYLVVIFFLLPLIFLTGLTMSPAVAAAYPFLLDMFFGAQSARTIHFFASIALELFLAVHLIMIIKTGFKEQMRAMIIGK